MHVSINFEALGNSSLGLLFDLMNQNFYIVHPRHLILYIMMLMQKQAHEPLSKRMSTNED